METRTLLVVGSLWSAIMCWNAIVYNFNDFSMSVKMDSNLCVFENPNSQNFDVFQSYFRGFKY